MAFRITLTDVSRQFGEETAESHVRAIANVNLTIQAGDFAVLMGPSGSGKSTLLNLLGTIDRPTAGEVVLGDFSTRLASERQLTLIRRRSIGFIFQSFHLLPALSVAENVAFPLALQSIAPREQKRRVDEVLDQVGLSHRHSHQTHQLSGGEMQRVAIARALVHHPELILADEPTGNLDSHTGEVILSLLQKIHRSIRPTIVMATHSERAGAIGDYVLHVVDGVVSEAVRRA